MVAIIYMCVGDWKKGSLGLIWEIFEKLEFFADSAFILIKLLSEQVSSLYV